MTTNSSRPELKFNRYDAVVAVVVALLAVAAALWFCLPRTQTGDLTVVPRRTAFIPAISAAAASPSSVSPRRWWSIWRAAFKAAPLT